MASTLEGIEQIQKNTLRIYHQGEVSVDSAKKFLIDLEYAYNCAYLFDSIGIQAEELLRLTGGELSMPARNLLWMHLWPPTAEKVASLVPDDQKLQLSSVELHSPRAWDFLGKLNPIEVLRQSLNDHHERRKDNEYCNAHEKEIIEFQNQLLRTEVVEGHLKNLEKLGITDDDKKILTENFLIHPIQELKTSQDTLLISGANLVDPDTEIAPNKEVMIIGHYGEISSKPLEVDYLIEDLPGGIKLELAPIPSGKFLMGSPITEPHRDEE